MQIRYGIVTAQNCFLHGNNSGIEDEVFSGWAVRVFPGTEENGRVKIETHYGYEGYVYKDQLALISRETLICRQDKTRFFRIGVSAADVLDQPKVQGLLLERLLKNSIVERVTEPSDTDGWCLVRTAAGVVGYMHENYLRRRQDDDGYLLEMESRTEPEFPQRKTQTEPEVLQKKTRTEPEPMPAGNEKGKMENSPENLTGNGQTTYFEKRFRENPPEEESFRDGVVRSARSYLGVQYRWGGKSSLGLDCSGLAFMSYLENGVLIYRDAKIKHGYPIFEIPREKLKPGDLIFFPGHVAIYLGEGRYIHSTGYKKTPYVTINSLNPADEEYRADLAASITACGSVFSALEPSFCSGTEQFVHERSLREGRTSDHKKSVTIYDEDSQQLQRPSGQDDKFDQFEALRRRLNAMPGNLSAVYKDLTTGESFSYRAKEPHIAASVIKLFLMAAVFQGFSEGSFSPEKRILIRREDCVPSCGVLTYLQGECTVSVRDLTELMIIVSDNTAANVLFDLVGEERLAEFLSDKLGLKKTVFRRKMFDNKRAAQGIENYVTAADAAWLLERIYKGELVSREASKEMYQILTHQRLNGKIPFYLHTFANAPVIAHKTGEDSGVTHDVAIVEGERPFVLCFLGNETNVADYERLMAETARDLYLKSW
ncbi:MAG: serine hydrolase [Lachnospiraceae bacterium]|nr:serine hydrolase [Lachnospiraceae bacterium]